MKRSLPLFVALILLALVAWLVLRPRSVPGPLETNRSPDSAATHAPSSQLADATTSNADSRRETTVEHTAVPESFGALADQKAQDDSASIRGRFLFDDGRPAVGVRLTLSGSIVSTSHSDAHLAPEPFERTVAESDASGRFEARFDVVPIFKYQLEGMLQGYGLVCWTWYSIAPRKVIDVGDVQLVRAGSVRGRILDAGGRVLVKDWSVTAVMSSTGEADRSSSTFVAKPTLPGGEFLIDNVPPGNVRLNTNSKLKTYAPDGVVVQVRAGEETRADLHYKGPNCETRIVAVARAIPFRAFDGDVAQIVVRAPDGTEHVAKKLEGSVTSFAVDDLRPGSYTLELRDPRYVPWSKSDVQQGTAVDLPLIGNATITLRVIDDATSAPVARYSLDVRLEDLKRLHKTFRLFDARREPPRDGVLGEVMPVEQTWIVQADGYARLEIPLMDVAPNDKRTIEARLVRGTAITGSVVSATSRRPLVGATVRIAPVRPRTDSKLPAGLLFDADVLATGTTDGQGRFAIPNLNVGSYIAKASFGLAPEVEQSFEITREHAPTELEFVLAATGRLVGRILAPPGTSFAGLSASVTSSNAVPGAEPPDSFLAPELARAVVNDVGEFTSSWILAGEARVVVAAAGLRLPTGPMTWQMIQGGTLDLGTVTLAPDVDTHRDFDLRESFPSTVIARVVVDGVPMTKAVVALYEPTLKKSLWAGITDANGVARIPRVASGTYSVSVRDANSTWSYLVPRELRVIPSLESAVDIDVRLISAELTLRGGDPAVPLIDSGVTFELEHSEAAPRVVAKTDALGRVRMLLPAGTWIVRHQGRSALAKVAFGRVEWTSTGPAMQTIDLVAEAR